MLVFITYEHMLVLLSFEIWVFNSQDPENSSMSAKHVQTWEYHVYTGDRQKYTVKWIWKAVQDQIYMAVMMFAKNLTP